MKSGRFLSLSSLVLTLGLASACSSSSEETPDASPDGSGSGAPKAQIVNCTTAVTKEIVTNAPSMYVPNALTVTAGTVVRFKMHADHNAKSLDNLFTIEYGATTCVQFNTAGSYRFNCTPHGFIGTVTVQ